MVRGSGNVDSESDQRKYNVYFLHELQMSAQDPENQFIYTWTLVPKSPIPKNTKNDDQKSTKKSNPQNPPRGPKRFISN